MRSKWTKAKPDQQFYDGDRILAAVPVSTNGGPHRRPPMTDRAAMTDAQINLSLMRMIQDDDFYTSHVDSWDCVLRACFQVFACLKNAQIEVTRSDVDNATCAKFHNVILPAIVLGTTEHDARRAIAIAAIQAWEELEAHQETDTGKGSHTP